MKRTDTAKLVQLRRVVGRRADIVTFARAYTRHFGDKDTYVVQKAKVLQLFRRYAGQVVVLPPALLTDFYQVWNPDTPERCRGCGEALVGRCPIEHKYCNDACRLGPNPKHTSDRLEEAVPELES